jgi:hypothetical protein
MGLQKKICCDQALLQVTHSRRFRTTAALLCCVWNEQSDQLTFPSLWHCVREICKLDINRRPARQITQCLLFILSSYWNGKSPVVYWTTRRFHCQYNEIASLNLAKRLRSLPHLHSTGTQCYCRWVSTYTQVTAMYAPVIRCSLIYIYRNAHWSSGDCSELLAVIGAPWTPHPCNFLPLTASSALPARALVVCLSTRGNTCGIWDFSRQ